MYIPPYLKSIGFYFKSIIKIWWALMSCAVFTFLGVYVILANKSSTWSVSATFFLAVFFFFLAGFSAWKKEHDALTSLQCSLDIPKIKGRIRTAFLDREQQRYYLEISLVNYAEVSCTVQDFKLRVSGAAPVTGTTCIRGTIEPFTKVGDYSISCPPTQIFPLQVGRTNPLVRAIEQIGWVEFYVENICTFLTTEAPGEETFSVIVIDSLGVHHPIEETRLSVQSALFHGGLEEDLKPYLTL